MSPFLLYFLSLFPFFSFFLSFLFSFLAFFSDDKAQISPLIASLSHPTLFFFLFISEIRLPFLSDSMLFLKIVSLSSIVASN